MSNSLAVSKFNYGFEWDDLPSVSFSESLFHMGTLSFTLPELADEVEIRYMLYYNINPICIYPYVTP